MDIVIIVIAIVATYLIGSFPAAYIIGRLRKGTDIRSEGSRNMGAMNVFYSVGFLEGVIVLLLDVGKGIAAIVVARYLAMSEAVQLLTGAAAVVGHVFPVFLKFRGGTGGATCIGVFSFLMPWGVPFYGAIFGTLLLLTRFPTLSYGVAFVCFPFVAWLIYGDRGLVALSAGLILFITVRYLPRIRQMRAKGGRWDRVLLRKGLSDRL